MVEKTLLYVQNYPNTLLILFLNVKLVTILEIEVKLFLTAELQILKFIFPILSRFGIV